MTKARTYVESTCDRINDTESYPVYRPTGTLIMSAKVCRINGGIDEALILTLHNGATFVAYVSEVQFI